MLQSLQCHVRACPRACASGSDVGCTPTLQWLKGLPSWGSWVAKTILWDGDSVLGAVGWLAEPHIVAHGTRKTLASEFEMVLGVWEHCPQTGCFALQFAVVWRLLHLSQRTLMCGASTGVLALSSYTNFGGEGKPFYSDRENVSSGSTLNTSFPKCRRIPPKSACSSIRA
jgi:hypothetical protein